MAETQRNGLSEFGDGMNRWLWDHGGSQVQNAVETGGAAMKLVAELGSNLISRSPVAREALSSGVLGPLGLMAYGALPRSLPAGQTGRPTNPHAAPRPPQAAAPWMARGGVRGAIMQGDAVLRDAANVVSLGNANPFSAGMAASLGGGLNDWRQRYDDDLADEYARDRYDAVNRPIAHDAGQLLGTVLGLMLAGKVAAPPTVASRLAGAAGLNLRERLALMAGSGAANTIVQDVPNALAGRPTPLPDQAASALGGAVTGAILPIVPGSAVAAGAWTTSAADDLFNGRQVDLGRAGQSSIVSSLLGTLANRIGTKGSNSLSSKAKGRVGEFMGDVRSTVNGQRREWIPRFRDPLNDEGDYYWYPDGLGAKTRFEDKFGYDADLNKPNQVDAQQLLGQRFVLNHFLPDDIGAIASVPAAIIGPGLVSKSDHDWQEFVRAIQTPDPLAPR